MKIYDTFIFNDELKLLELRLLFLDECVDYFVLIESKRTLSGLIKPLYFHENKHLFKKYLHKIIYLEAPVNNMSAWEYEYFQRNYIKRALEECKAEDWILISDVDEIVNIPYILTRTKEKQPYLIELPMYYYWLNVKTSSSFFVNLISPWKYIQNVDIGERYRTFPKLFSNRIRNKDLRNGWHFSYLFGNDISRYQSKIKSFSHQEYNSSYYLNPNRIQKCIQLNIDLFERESMKLKVIDKEIKILTPYIRQLQLDIYLYKYSLKFFNIPENIFFITKIRMKNVLRKSKTLFKKSKNRMILFGKNVLR